MKVDVLTNSTKRHEDGLAVISLRVEGLEEEYELHLPFKEIHQRFGIPDAMSLDFLMVASLSYLVDKAVSRRTAVDNWTRHFEIEFPVSAPESWRGVAADLETALSFLTGDIWELSFRQSEVLYFRPPRIRRRRRRIGIGLLRDKPKAVCLFSGGLDSLTGAIDLVKGDEAQKILLIGHYDSPGPKSQQEALFTRMRAQYPGRMDLLQTRVSHKPEAAHETTLRSRSLVFMALGIYAARFAGGNVPLYAPENGVIAINVPLTPSRAGSCSTRTMHPFFLDRLEKALRGLGISNAIINPFQIKSKGECLAGCLDQPLLQSLIKVSVSCSHSTRRQNWTRKDANNCGYCVPCIFRRAAVHKAGFDNGREYGIDICNGEMPIDDEAESGDDLRAMLDFLRQRKSMAALARDMRGIARVDNEDGIAATLERGFDEVRALIRDKAQPAIRRAAGITVKDR